MSGLEIGLVSLVGILVLIYAGMHIAVALALVSFICVWAIRGDPNVAVNLLILAASDSVASYTFGVVPLFVLMGLFVSVSDLGKDIYEVARHAFRRIKGGLGIATVFANAVFAAVTGISIASAAVFTRVSVPEMLRFGYRPRFAVGVVAGSSVLGMLIPPSVLLIVYALLTEQSVGSMFIAGVVPGILLSLVYCAGIFFMAWVFPAYVGGKRAGSEQRDPSLGIRVTFAKVTPIVILILAVLGGIYGGIFTPTEAGGVGALAALIIALWKRKLPLRVFWQVLVETGHITASILFLIVAATMYSRMLGTAGIPTLLGSWVANLQISFAAIMTIYVILLLLAGTILDAVSIILILAPLFLPIVTPFGADLVWFGLVTVLGAEIGLLTPPLGIACFVIKGTLADTSISLNDIFMGAIPFAVMMLFVLILVIAFPKIVLILL